MEDATVYWLYERNPGVEVEEGVYIQNKTGRRLIIHFEVEIDDERDFKDSAFIESDHRHLLCQLSRMDLNHSPTIYCRLWEDSTAGRDYLGIFRIPLRQKLLKKAPEYRETLGGKIYDLQLIRMQDGDRSELEEYTRRLSQREEANEQFSDLKFFDPAALAEFKDEIDLHAEYLLDDPGRYNRTVILEVQMKAFRSYLENALRLGKDRVYIIHGLGKGTLRDRIHEVLEKHPFVASYSDDYHPKYGHGATAVEFQ